MKSKPAHTSNHSTHKAAPVSAPKKEETKDSESPDKDIDDKFDDAFGGKTINTISADDSKKPGKEDNQPLFTTEVVDETPAKETSEEKEISISEKVDSGTVEIVGTNSEDDENRRPEIPLSVDAKSESKKEDPEKKTVSEANKKSDHLLTSELKITDGTDNDSDKPNDTSHEELETLWNSNHPKPTSPQDPDPTPEVIKIPEVETKANKQEIPTVVKREGNTESEIITDTEVTESKTPENNFVYTPQVVDNKKDHEKEDELKGEKDLSTPQDAAVVDEDGPKDEVSDLSTSPNSSDVNSYTSVQEVDNENSQPYLVYADEKKLKNIEEGPKNRLSLRYLLFFLAGVIFTLLVLGGVYFIGNKIIEKNNNILNNTNINNDSKTPVSTTSAKIATNSASAAKVIEPIINRSEYKLRILNGTRQEGIATTVANKLQSLGYQISAIGNATNSAFTITTIRTKPNTASIAAQLIKDLAPDYQATAEVSLKDSVKYDAEVIIGKK